MRLVPILLAAFVASGPVLAQGWEEYAYPDYAFAIDFPANPQIETTTFQVAPDRSVPAQVYSVSQNNVLLKMTLADLTNTNLTENAIIDHAIKMLSEAGAVTVHIPARIYRVYGRQLTIDGADGTQSMIQLFHYKGRLYQIEAKAHSRHADDAQSEVVRFHQSLNFLDGGTNRTQEEVRAIRDVCKNLPNPAFGAGLDDPACAAP
jgi:hypothetical protein